MGSSFLSTISVALAAYSGLRFLNLIIKFGLPNHPAILTLYLVIFSTSAFFFIGGLGVLEVVAPIVIMRWKILPLVVGALALLLQVVSISGRFSLIQQKVISRLPLMTGLLIFAFFPAYSNYFFILCVMASLTFLIFLVRNARFQKRTFIKMTIFLTIYLITENYWPDRAAGLFLFPALFYFYMFQESFGIMAKVEQFEDGV